MVCAAPAPYGSPAPPRIPAFPEGRDVALWRAVEGGANMGSPVKSGRYNPICIRQFGRDQQQYTETEVIPITPRALEALIRLTEAHARMHLREVASADDAKMALAIFRHWREEAGIEDESELASGVSVSQRNAGNTVRSIIRDLCSDKGVAELTEILNRSETRGVNEYQVEEVLSRMLQGGELFEISHERYSFAR